jgi:hypothetical protein
MPVEGESVAVQIIKVEFAGNPGSVANAIGGALNATFPEFGEERVWILYQKPQSDRAHFVVELKLHVELDRITAESDVIRRIGLVSKSQIEAELLGVELNRPLDLPRADNWVSFLEHCRLL